MLPSRIARFSFVPLEIRRALYHVGAARCPEEDLFQNVIGRAVMDALGFTGLDEPSDHNTAVSAARVWFKFGDNVAEYFEMARVENVHIVRKEILAVSPKVRPERPKKTGKECA